MLDELISQFKSKDGENAGRLASSKPRKQLVLPDKAPHSGSDFGKY
jgi:hypothetical protein